MNPINYGEIIEKAEARRAALEEIVALMTEIYPRWKTICESAHGLKAIHEKVKALDFEGHEMLAQAVGMKSSEVRLALENLALCVREPHSDAIALLQAVAPKELT